MIDITEKGHRRLKELLGAIRHRGLSRAELIDLAILEELWDLRELAGAPIERDELSPQVIADKLPKQWRHYAAPSYILVKINTLISDKYIEKVR